MAVEQVDLNVSSRKQPQLRDNGQSSTNKGKFATSACDPRTGNWVRDLHIKADGCDKTTGARHLVL